MILDPLVTKNDDLSDWERRKEKVASRIHAFVGSGAQEPAECQPQILEESDCGTHIRRKVTYDYAKEDPAFVYLLFPKDLKGPAPAVICNHGSAPLGKDTMVGLDSSGNSEHRGYAIELVQRGYVVLAPDYFLAGEREVWGKSFDTTKFNATFPDWCVEGKAINDGRRDLDYLTSLDMVDTGRIACMGNSLGGDRSVWTAAFDERVALVVCSCGLFPKYGYNGRGWQAVGSKNTGFHKGKKLVHPRVMEMAADVQDWPYEAQDLLSLIAPRPLLLTHAFHDPYANNMVIHHETSHHLNQLYTLHDAEKHYAQLFHGDGHDTQPWVREMMYAWIDRFFKGSP